VKEKKKGRREGKKRGERTEKIRRKNLLARCEKPGRKGTKRNGKKSDKFSGKWPMDGKNKALAQRPTSELPLKIREKKNGG